MRQRWGRRPSTKFVAGVLLMAAAAAGGLLGNFAAMASLSHYDPGTSGSHSSGSYSYNPGHIWVAIGAPTGNTVTSGGGITTSVPACSVVPMAATMRWT